MGLYSTKLSGCARQAHRGWQFESQVKDDAATRTTEIIMCCDKDHRPAVELW